MTTVGILGTMYGIEGYDCTTDFYVGYVEAFNPDVICGEVHPDTWKIYQSDKSRRGFRGEAEDLYYDGIFPYCESKGALFVPVDWFELDVWDDFDPFYKVDGERRRKLLNEWDLWFDRQKAVWNEGNIPFNSFEYDDIARLKYAWLYGINPESQIFRWICRNQIMVQRVKNAIKNHPSKRILCIAGADHNYCYYDGLKGENIGLIYPLRR